MRKFGVTFSKVQSKDEMANGYGKEAFSNFPLAISGFTLMEAGHTSGSSIT